MKTGYANSLAGFARATAVTTALLLSACASTPPPPDWQANAFSALNGFSSAYLSGNTRLAELELARARTEISRTGRADLLARAELTRCAALVASLVFEPCRAYLPLAADAGPEAQAYAAFLSGQWNGLDAKLLPPHYRAIVLSPTVLPGVLAKIEDPMARLIAAGVLLQRQSTSPADRALAVDTAAAQGWRRPLLAWLGVQLKLAQVASQTGEASRLQRRIDLVLESPSRSP
jgi:hypothetical protein